MLLPGFFQHREQGVPTAAASLRRTDAPMSPETLGVCFLFFIPVILDFWALKIV